MTPPANFAESGCPHDFATLRATTHAVETERRVALIVGELAHLGFRGTAAVCSICGEFRLALHRPAQAAAT